MPKRFLLKNISGKVKPIAGGGDKGIRTFLKGINSNVSVIARLWFELAY